MTNPPHPAWCDPARCAADDPIIRSHRSRLLALGAGTSVHIQAPACATRPPVVVITTPDGATLALPLGVVAALATTTPRLLLMAGVRPRRKTG